MGQAEGDEPELNGEAPPQDAVNVKSPESEQVAVVVEQPSVAVR